jgi:hypothetical protein
MTQKTSLDLCLTDTKNYSNGRFRTMRKHTMLLLTHGAMTVARRLYLSVNSVSYAPTEAATLVHVFLHS